MREGLKGRGYPGRNLVVQQQTKGGQKYLSYRHKTLPASRGCLTLHKSAPALEAAVVAQVQRLAKLPETREAALALARESLSQGAVPLGREQEQVSVVLAAGARGSRSGPSA